MALRCLPGPSAAPDPYLSLPESLWPAAALPSSRHARCASKAQTPRAVMNQPDSIQDEDAMFEERLPADRQRSSGSRAEGSVERPVGKHLERDCLPPMRPEPLARCSSAEVGPPPEGMRRDGREPDRVRAADPQVCRRGQEGYHYLGRQLMADGIERWTPVLRNSGGGSCRQSRAATRGRR